MVTTLPQTPGVYREEVFPTPPPVLLTGVPVFLGLMADGPINVPQLLTLWPQFGERFGEPLAQGYLAYAIRGFFENGGRLCYGVRLDPDQTPDVRLERGLAAIAPLTTLDLVCVPDLMWGQVDQDTVLRLQNNVLRHCDLGGDRFAILDSLAPLASAELTLDQSVSRVQQHRRGLQGHNGALYYPWIKVEAMRASSPPVWVPPCGHIAGVYARSDNQIGVHKAPANAVLEGVLDLKGHLVPRQQDQLNPRGVNCLRVFPGRGIRIWGARTLSRDPNWRYINVRRLLITIGRWLELNLADVAFEANTFRLWVRIERELTAYLGDLLRQGALRGPTEQAAFYVKCDAETNPPEVREAGKLVTDIGFAAAVPNEFITVRLVLGDSGVTVAT